MYAKWIQSYRDLPLLINQWANVVRWEMRTRLFLRTTEFLWQEGHTAHATEAEAEEETRRMLGVYRTFMEEWMAMPVLTGRKTDSERFAGALRTYSCEALMQDNKALQAGTSHNLGQNFARAFEVTFQTAAGDLDHVWNTSWGVSTRLVGALIMTHGDDAGWSVRRGWRSTRWSSCRSTRPTRSAPRCSRPPTGCARSCRPPGSGCTWTRREGMKPGAKYYEWEGRGVPLRLEIGPRDVAVRHGDAGAAHRRQEGEPADGRARRPRSPRRWTRCSGICSRPPARGARPTASAAPPRSSSSHMLEADGGFVYGGFCGRSDCETEIKEQTKATIRVLPDEEFRSPVAPATCMWCGRPSVARGGVGEGVLTAGQRGSGRAGQTARLFADAGLGAARRRSASGGVRAARHRRAGGHADLRLQRGRDPRPLPRAGRGAGRRCRTGSAFAVKANGNLAVLRILRDLGAGADIVSGGELARALAAGFDPERIVFSGVGKTDGGADRGGRGRDRPRPPRVAPRSSRRSAGSPARLGADVRVGIRVNPDVTADTHPYIATGQGGIKFGVPIDQVLPLARAVARHPLLTLDTLAMHLGSQLLDARALRARGSRGCSSWSGGCGEAGVTTLALDRHRRRSRHPLSRRAAARVPPRWPRRVVPLVAPSGLTLLLEPGRFLVGSAGVLLTRVLYRKHSGGKELVIVDAGMNDLVRPSHYMAYHEIVELEAPGRPAARGGRGRPGLRDRRLPGARPHAPGLERGRALAVLGAGAYGFVMASNYNTRPRPAEVMVDDGRWWVARPREARPSTDVCSRRRAQCHDASPMRPPSTTTAS